MMPEPLGDPVSTAPAARPDGTRLAGRYTRVEPLDPARHGDDLHAAATGPDTDALWTYMSFGPWAGREGFDRWLAGLAGSTDPFPYAIVDTAAGRALGMASYMRIEPAHRVIEIGSIWYAPALQRSRAATEAMYLLARHAFETLGYRRYEWKCNSHNAPSRRAAARLGFTYEGLFRQHMIVRGRSRDTDWFSMLDVEWPARRAAFERWLAPENFDAAGRQRAALSAFAAD